MHVAGHHRRDDHAVVVDGDARAAQLAALVIAEPDAGSGRRLGAEPLRRDALHHVVARDLGADLLESVALAVGQLAVFELDAGVFQRDEQGVAEHLVGDRPPGDLLGRAYILTHVLDDLVLELVVGHVHHL